MRRWSLNKLPWYKMIDIPPIWLLGFALLARWQAQSFNLGLTFGSDWASFLGGLCFGGGALLLLLALMEMRKHRTTVVPHLEAASLVTSGIFKYSRNPIYLGDALMLLGLILWWDAVLALPLVALFIFVMEKRFIIPEENALRRKFGAEFARYCLKTRRFV